MTITIRRDDEISDVDGEWFRARWHFSFDTYRDPDYTSFGTLRVFNDDRLIPGAIWPMHPHRDIEGLTYVVEGSFRHQDDVGGAPGPLPAGSVQRMTLGSGAWHSEQNASQTEPMRFIQIWIMPAERGSDARRRAEGLHRGGSNEPPAQGDQWRRRRRGPRSSGRARVRVAPGRRPSRVTHPLGVGRGVYLYVIDGDVTVNDERMTTGDAAKIWDETEIRIDRRRVDVELILVDVGL